MQELVSSRRVWLPRLLHFDAEDAPRIALYVDIYSLPVADLKYLVISARRSREAWRRPGAVSISPTRYQEIELPYRKYVGPFMHQILEDNGLEDLLPSFGGNFSRRAVNILPIPLPFGNRHEYIVIRRLPYYIQIVEVSSGECIWQCDNSDVPVIAFDVDSTCIDVGAGEVFKLLTSTLTRKADQSLW